MTTFRKFDHVERLGHLETVGIEIGTVHVFSKIDGSNAVVWLGADGRIQCGSRNRQLGEGHDNHGFRGWLFGESTAAAALRAVVSQRPGFVFYGEWLVPHTIRTYREDSWRRFFVFDVFDVAAGRYVPYDVYSAWLVDTGADFLKPLVVLQDPSSAQLMDLLSADRTLLRDGAPGTEGIVCKNYGWMNRFQRQPWAKLVNAHAMGESRATPIPRIGGTNSEDAIAAKYVTEHLVAKTRAKLVADLANKNGIDLMRADATLLVESQFRNRLIPALLGTVFSELIREEMWSIVKEGKDPRVDFGLLRRATILRTKELAADLFGNAAPAVLPPYEPAPVGGAS